MTQKEKQPPWWKGAVIYQIYPRSFQDANGDGIGDLAGITERLDYVASLGVDGLWLSPFFVSPMADFGYDIADYKDVDPVFGTLADFQSLVARAHEFGLKVIIDQVYSHTSDRHPWFFESRQDRSNEKADWYVWADPKPDGTPPNNWLSVFGGPAWTWDGRRRQYYLHNFLSAQPDLNFHCQGVQDAILDVARFWLDLGVDGFRLDVANFYAHDPEMRDNPPRGRPGGTPYRYQRHLYDKSQPAALRFVERLRACVDGYDERMLVGEIVDDDMIARQAEYAAGSGRLHTAYSFIFLGRRLNAAFVSGAVQDFLDRDGPAWPSWAFSNHDVVRAVTRLGGDDAPEAFAKLLVALLGALPGTAFLYQGDELGLTQANVPFNRLVDPGGIVNWPEDQGRDVARTPLPWVCDGIHAGFSTAEPWLPVDPAHASRAVDRQRAEPGSVLAFTRRFLHWRRAALPVADPRTRFLTPAMDGEREGPLAFTRGEGARQTLCVFNLSGTDTTFSLPGGMAAELALAEGASCQGRTVTLDPYGVAFATASHQ